MNFKICGPLYKGSWDFTVSAFKMLFREGLQKSTSQQDFIVYVPSESHEVFMNVINGCYKFYKENLAAKGMTEPDPEAIRQYLYLYWDSSTFEPVDKNFQSPQDWKYSYMRDIYGGYSDMSPYNLYQLWKQRSGNWIPAEGNVIFSIPSQDEPVNKEPAKKTERETVGDNEMEIIFRTGGKTYYKRFSMDVK